MGIQEIAIKVAGMSCNHCKAAVEKAVKALPGVQQAEVDLAAGTTRVVFDPGITTSEAIIQTIIDADYRVVE
jgi:copper chaperone CopZ